MTANIRYAPDFIIIGAMKCATSTLHDQLSQYESFFMTDPKEPNFFSDDSAFGKGINWYGSLFERANPGQIKGESSTHYTKLPTFPNTLKRMQAYCPHIKCIYLMRHPVDRLVSHYIHEWSQRVINCDISQAIHRYPELIYYGCYYRQIQPYLDTFGASRVLPVFVERLQDDPNRELKRIFTFLDVDEKPSWRFDLRSNVSSERLRTCAWRDTIVNNTVLSEIRRNFVPKGVRNMIKSLWTLKEKPRLSPQALLSVQTEFDKDLQHIGILLGLDLNCHNFKDKVRKQDQIMWAV